MTAAMAQAMEFRDVLVTALDDRGHIEIHGPFRKKDTMEAYFIVIFGPSRETPEGGLPLGMWWKQTPNAVLNSELMTKCSSPEGVAQLLVGRGVYHSGTATFADAQFEWPRL